MSERESTGASVLVGVTIGVVVLIAAGFALNAARYLNAKIFAPRMEQVRRETFTRSQEYNEGMVRRLYDERRQYLSAPDAGSKTILRETFLHDAEGYPNPLPADLQSFKSTLEGGQQ